MAMKAIPRAQIPTKTKVPMFVLFARGFMPFLQASERIRMPVECAFTAIRKE
jgi:hypothetical protein